MDPVYINSLSPPRGVLVFLGLASNFGNGVVYHPTQSSLRTIILRIPLYRPPCLISLTW